MTGEERIPCKNNVQKSPCQEAAIWPISKTQGKSLWLEHRVGVGRKKAGLVQNKTKEAGDRLYQTV